MVNCHRQLRLELYAAVDLNEEPHPGLQHCFGGNVIEGEPLMLNMSVRPQPAAAAAVSALAATAGKTSSDESLVEQIAAGNKPAMQVLFARHRTYVYRWLLRFVSNETLAEDLLSEVFLDVWRQAGRFERRSSVSTWLLAIARHKALSACRRRTEAAELDAKIEATIADPANDPEVALQEKDRAEVLRRALTRLSPQHREVIDLVYYHEKSVDEVAHILDVPHATVKTRMFYARKKLADLINGPEKVGC
jgi:RNA polymerase sigma-70 factor, ECF subfamily